MSEAEPTDTRPIETANGQLIVYTLIGEAGVYVDCPALEYGLGMPRTSYNEESVRHSFETLVRSNSRALLVRASSGEQFSDSLLAYAKRFADEETALPFVFVKNFDVRLERDLNSQH